MSYICGAINYQARKLSIVFTKTVELWSKAYNSENKKHILEKVQEDFNLMKEKEMMCSILN